MYNQIWIILNYFISTTVDIRMSSSLCSLIKWYKVWILTLSKEQTMLEKNIYIMCAHDLNKISDCFGETISWA